MIKSISREVAKVEIPHFDGEIKMQPFSLQYTETWPAPFRQTIEKMIAFLPNKQGVAYLTVDGKEVQQGQTQRRGGAHIDGNYLPECNSWGGGGGNGWKVGEGGRILNSIEHMKSYESATGGMIIASTYPACRGWNGEFEGKPYVGGDCTQIHGLGEGFTLQPNIAYYGNSQFIHESLPIDKTTHRTIIRITLPIDYPVIE